MTSKSYIARAQKVKQPTSRVAEELELPVRGRKPARIVIGRHEWISLPEFGAGPLRAKTDTGARSSCLHAEDIRLSDDGGRVSFTTLDHYGRRISCEAKVAGRKKVKSSTGTARKRIYIETDAIVAGGFRWRIRLTLSDRTSMRCPMLLGREAMSGYFMVDPQANHLAGPLQDLEGAAPEIRPDPA